MRYRKKPVVVEAFKWTGGPDQTEDPEWIVKAIGEGKVRFEHSGTPQVVMLIDTLEGVMKANQGDYIIKRVKDEIYPCKSDIFEMTYVVAPQPLSTIINSGWWTRLKRWCSTRQEQTMNRIWHSCVDHAINKALHGLTVLGQNNGPCQVHLDEAKDALYKASLAIHNEQ